MTRARKPFSVRPFQKLENLPRLGKVEIELLQEMKVQILKPPLPKPNMPHIPVGYDLYSICRSQRVLMKWEATLLILSRNLIRRKLNKNKKDESGLLTQPTSGVVASPNLTKIR